MLSCFCTCSSWIDLSFLILFFALAAASHQRYGLNHQRRLKLASVTLGVNAGKKLISLCLILSLAFVSLPLKSFVLFCYTDYILSVNKSCERGNAPRGSNITQLFFFSSVYQTINRKVAFLAVNCENYKQALELFLSCSAIEQHEGDRLSSTSWE